MTPWFGDAWSIVSLRGLGTDSDSRHKQVMLGVMAMGPQQLSQSQPRKLLDSRLRSSRWHVMACSCFAQERRGGAGFRKGRGWWIPGEVAASKCKTCVAVRDTRSGVVPGPEPLAQTWQLKNPAPPRMGKRHTRKAIQAATVAATGSGTDSGPMDQVKHGRKTVSQVACH